MNDRIKVSVCCVTYNQEKYIKQAIESFINQKTDFKFEIIVHDDASTDGTQDIIKQFHKAYPDLIVPIYEKKNIYSVSRNSILTKVLRKSRGEYIAICEGDDAWIDINKLKFQVDYMDKYKNIKLCAHNTAILNSENKIIDNFNNINSKEFTIGDILSDKIFIHTSSMLFRKKDVEQLPMYYHKATVGDLPLKLYLLSKGNGYYIDRIMSLYRKNAIGSWSEAQKKDLEKLKKNHESEIALYEAFNEETNFKYDIEIKNKILFKDFIYYKDTNNLKEIKKEKYKKFYDGIPFREKIKLKIKSNKKIYNLILKFKERSQNERK